MHKVWPRKRVSESLEDSQREGLTSGDPDTSAEVWGASAKGLANFEKPLDCF